MQMFKHLQIHLLNIEKLLWGFCSLCSPSSCFSFSVV